MASGQGATEAAEAPDEGGKVGTKESAHSVRGRSDYSVQFLSTASSHCIRNLMSPPPFLREKRRAKKQADRHRVKLLKASGATGLVNNWIVSTLIIDGFSSVHSLNS